MFQTVKLHANKLSKECRDHYNMANGVVEAQIFIDTELYGIAIEGFSIDRSSPYFSELKKRCLLDKRLTDKEMREQAERDAHNRSQVVRDEKTSIIRSWNLAPELESEFIEVFVNA